jgi:hypothetical protein
VGTGRFARTCGDSRRPLTGPATENL